MNISKAINAYDALLTSRQTGQLMSNDMMKGSFQKQTMTNYLTEKEKTETKRLKMGRQS